MSITIGIDLGTSTTEAAIFRDGKKELIPNPDGRIITPSAIGLDESGNWVVGERAKAQYLLFPEKTAMEVKRKTGTDETVRLGHTEYAPVELQARQMSTAPSFPCLPILMIFSGARRSSPARWQASRWNEF